MKQPGREPHACIDGLTGLETRHPQVPMFYYTVDEDITDLISIMNYCGIHTVNSCQDNSYNRGMVCRVWAQVLAQDLLLFLSMLDRPEEAGDVESLSHRMTNERYPDQDYEDNRAWHYRPHIQRAKGELIPLTISVRFPHTGFPHRGRAPAGSRHATRRQDLPAVTRRDPGPSRIEQPGRYDSSYRTR